MNSPDKNRAAIYVRNAVFGVEDSLVSTVGLLSGIVAGGVERGTIVLTGVVLILVEAFSMAVGSFLSEESAEEYVLHREVSDRKPFAAAVVIFFSYLVSGLIPLSPYMIFGQNAFGISIAASLAALFLLGILSAKAFHIRVFRNGLRTFMIGGLAVLAGVLVGKALK